MLKLPRELIETYIKRREEDVKTLENSIALSSVEEFNRIGHQLMGNSRNFGFPELEQIAGEMEYLKTDELPTRAPELLKEFKKWLESNRVT